MQMVWRLGLPSSNQLSGWTIISGTRANGIIGPIAVMGWMSGPDRRKGRSRASARPAARAAIDSRAAPPSRRSRADRRPGRQDSTVRRKPAVEHRRIGREAHVDPSPGNPAAHPLPERTGHRRIPFTPESRSAPMVSTRPKRVDRARILDHDPDEPADQPLGPLEHHDPIAARSGPSTGRLPSQPSRRAVFSLGPSTSTSTVLPINRRLSSRLIAVCKASSSLFRRFLTASGTSSG